MTLLRRRSESSWDHDSILLVKCALKFIKNSVYYLESNIFQANTNKLKKQCK